MSFKYVKLSWFKEQVASSLRLGCSIDELVILQFNILTNVSAYVSLGQGGFNPRHSGTTRSHSAVSTISLTDHWYGCAVSHSIIQPDSGAVSILQLNSSLCELVVWLFLVSFLTKKMQKWDAPLLFVSIASQLDRANSVLHLIRLENITCNSLHSLISSDTLSVRVPNASQQVSYINNQKNGGEYHTN